MLRFFILGQKERRDDTIYPRAHARSFSHLWCRPLTVSPHLCAQSSGYNCPLPSALQMMIVLNMVPGLCALGPTTSTTSRRPEPFLLFRKNSSKSRQPTTPHTGVSWVKRRVLLGFGPVVFLLMIMISSPQILLSFHFEHRELVSTSYLLYNKMKMNKINKQLAVENSR